MSLIPAWRPPYRYDLHKIFERVMSLPAKGELRAKELYIQGQLLAAETGEPLSDLMWTLARFQPDRDQANEEAPDEHQQLSLLG